ncbi:hypothetical protein ARMGADRAFT_1004714 [Armillaria gallica]|uniref:Uncharacterized protein n=1 Tax=Armillaria gallica TaxID=47427 RepID=A0A2H3E9E2_ARMGA|nr:hypothetical protein ARMGADRAFT_1004714 [Armillaria gallica]
MAIPGALRLEVDEFCSFPSGCIATTHQAKSRKETMETLDSMLDIAKDLGNEGKAKKMRTDNSVKDTYQLVFLDRLFKLYKKFRLKDKKLQALHSCVVNLPVLSGVFWNWTHIRILRWKSSTLFS